MEIIERFFSFKFMLTEIPQIIKFLPVTLWMAFASSVIGWTLGFFTAVIRIRRIPVLNQLAGFYISLIRGTPLMVQIYLTYYGIPIIIVVFHALRGDPTAPANAFSPIIFAIAAFSLNCGAYSSETIRAAIISVDRGQIEAAYSVGLTNVQAMRRITLPQALTVVVPMLGNSLMSNLLGTSLAFSVSVVDITASARLVGGRSYRYFEVFVIVAAIYWVACFIVGQITRRIEKRLRVPDVAE
jgi:His/Glu/Gln/Arg/opine family amino acid ABC transporter permease subunit